MINCKQLQINICKCVGVIFLAGHIIHTYFQLHYGHVNHVYNMSWSWASQNNKCFPLSLQAFWCHWHLLLVTLNDILECFHQKLIYCGVDNTRASSSSLCEGFFISHDLSFSHSSVSNAIYIFLTYITYSDITCIIN